MEKPTMISSSFSHLAVWGWGHELELSGRHLATTRLSSAIAASSRQWISPSHETTMSLLSFGFAHAKYQALLKERF